MNEGNRELTDDERKLVRWMLEHGTNEALAYLPQLELAEVTPDKCPCGCASIIFQLRGQAKAPPGVNILSDFHFGQGDSMSGIFLYSSQGILSGLEVYGFGSDAPRLLPRVEDLRPMPP